MDPKALAKSKRTHSQHGRRHHPPPPASALKKKPPQAAGEERSGRSEPKTLPSNWSRYAGGDDDRQGSENQIGVKPVDSEIAPKSKGADFSYLIEQARSQPQDFHRSGPETSYFNEFELDFTQGVSSMLSVKGENLLSWCRDDNFIVDDDSTPSLEIPFLSMDLHALAAQLSKVKLSQRLFIETDLLPEEQYADEPERCSVTEEEPQTSECGHSSDPAPFKCLARLENRAESQHEKDHSSIGVHHGIYEGELAKDLLPRASTSLATKPTPIIDSKLLEQLDSTEVQGVSISYADPNWKKPSNASRFETASAEAETDVILDPFGQPSISNDWSVGQDPGPSKSTARASLDDTIDDLLAETSVFVTKVQNPNVFPRKDVVPSAGLLPQVPPLGPEPTKSPGLSGFPTGSIALNDSIDDLLAETSFCLDDQKSLPKDGAALSVSRPTLGSKAADDFDSWFDSL